MEAMVDEGKGRNLAIFVGALLVPLILVVMWERGAAARLNDAPEEASGVALASASESDYCSVELKQIVRRVAGACGLLENGARGCKPADAKSVASLSGDDFNKLFIPLNKGEEKRAHIIQFDSEQTTLDDGAARLVERAWSDQRGASFFFVVARASTDGDAEYNQQLSQQRAQAVLGHLEDKFKDDAELKSSVGLLWLGEDYAQLSGDFCSWDRSREAECKAADINRSAFIAWIDCAI